MTMTWNQLIDAFLAEGWSVAAGHVGVTIETDRQGERTVLRDFSRDTKGLSEAQQFWKDYLAGLCDIAQPSLDRIRASFQQRFCEERAAGRVNALDTLQASQHRRKGMEQALQRLQHACTQLGSLLDELPRLPDERQISWARAVLAMPNLAFLEIDTTGLSDEDEVIRFTLVGADDQVIEDVLIRPLKEQLSASASEANGIKPEQLERALAASDVWERIRKALTGRYVISFGLEWDTRRLNQTATWYHLEPVLVIGDCLQRHACYYNGEHYLKLEELCARAGAPLPTRPYQTSFDRARGQLAVLQAMARAVTDLRPAASAAPETESSVTSEPPAAGDEFDPFLDDDDLP